METKNSIEFKLDQLGTRTFKHKVNLAGGISVTLGSYADNAAAVAAGLAVGDLYILTGTKAVTVVTP